MSAGRMRIEGESALEEGPRPLVILQCPSSEVVHPPDPAVVHVEAGERLAPGAPEPDGVDLRPERGGHPGHDLVLHGEEPVGRHVEALGPDLSPALGLDQLGVNPEAFPQPAHAPTKMVRRSQLGRSGSAERLGGLVVDDLQRGKPRQLRDQLLDKAPGEIALLGVTRGVLEGEDGDGGCGTHAGAESVPRRARRKRLMQLSCLSPSREAHSGIVVPVPPMGAGRSFILGRPSGIRTACSP
jgi:hypothetical protein